MATSEYQSPCGTLLLVADGDSLLMCEWKGSRNHRATLGRIKRHLVEVSPDGQLLLEEVRQKLDEYFAGKLTEFDIPLAPEGTEFQRKVWAALKTVGYGETATYSEIAERIGNPKAVRAVASAIGSNPLSVILPCHRVIGKDGKLTGYAGGLDVKRFLLRLEGIKVQ